MGEELITTVYSVISAFTEANLIEKKPPPNTPKYPIANQPPARENSLKKPSQERESNRKKLQENWVFSGQFKKLRLVNQNKEK